MWRLVARCRGWCGSGLAATAVSNLTDRESRRAEMDVTMWDAKIVGCSGNVWDIDDFRFRGTQVLELDFKTERWLARELDRDGLDRIRCVLMISGTVAVSLSRSGEACTRSGMNLLRDSKELMLLRIVVVVEIGQLSELVFVCSRMIGFHSNGRNANSTRQITLPH